MGMCSLLGPINGRNSMYLVCTHWILCFCPVGQRPERSTLAISGDATGMTGILLHSGIKLPSLNLKHLMRQIHFSYLVSGDADGKCYVWDWKTTKLYKKWKAHDSVCIGVLWHPHEPSKLVTAGWDGLIKYWD